MDGLMPTMKSGDILGHEFMGEVIETGSAHNKFRKGDRIIVPFNINCGECRHRLNCRPGQNAGDTGVARVEKVPTPGCGQARGKPARSRGALQRAGCV
jgi:threonine dehydrogenase-like Zn-dependent dehydrogenase